MKIEHVAIYYGDLEKAKKFFETYFEVTIGEKYHNEKTGFQSYFLSFENGARLEIMTRKDVVENKKDIFSTGIAHIAISIGGKRMVEEKIRQLQDNNFRIISPPRITGDGYFEASFFDIEDNVIEICE